MQLEGARLVSACAASCEQWFSRIIVSRSVGPNTSTNYMHVCLPAVCSEWGTYLMCAASCWARPACLLVHAPRVCVQCGHTHACILASLYPHVHVYCLFGSRAHAVVMPWLHGRWCACVPFYERRVCAALLFTGGRHNSNCTQLPSLLSVQGGCLYVHATAFSSLPLVCCSAMPCWGFGPTFV